MNHTIFRNSIERHSYKRKAYPLFEERRQSYKRRLAAPNIHFILSPFSTKFHNSEKVVARRHRPFFEGSTNTCDIYLRAALARNQFPLKHFNMQICVTFSASVRND